MSPGVLTRGRTDATTNAPVWTAQATSILGNATAAGVATPAPQQRPANETALLGRAGASDDAVTSGDGETAAPPSGIVDDAVAALMRALRDGDDETFADASSRLRRAARASRRRAPRHAAMALLLSDALTFTSPTSEPQPARQSLLLGLRQLQESFISADAERSVVQGLLAGGWNLTAPFDTAGFAAITPAELPNR